MIVRTAKLSDREIVDGLKQLSDRFENSSISLHLSLGVSRQLETDPEFDDPSYTEHSRNIQKATFIIGSGHHVVFGRGIFKQQPSSQIHPTTFAAAREPSGIFDEWGFFDPQPNTTAKVSVSDDDKIYVSNLLNEFADPLQIGSDGEARQLSVIASKQIGDLRKLSTDFAKRTAVAREADEAAYNRRLQKMEDTFSERNERMETAEAELEAKKKELNDREPKHERRRIRGDLTSRLQSAISEPKLQTITDERKAYHWYLIAGGIFVCVSFFASYGLYRNPTVSMGGFWILAIKGVASGALGAGLIWSGLAGLKSSSIAARHYEQRIQKYAFDMDRASWIVETLIEMNSLEAANVPDQWLESVCHHLFAVDGGKVEEPKALGALAALLDATASAKVGTNGLEFQIDRKGAKQMAKEADT